MTRSLILGLCLTSPTVVRWLKGGATSEPELLTYKDLVALYEDDTPDPEIQSRPTKLLSTP